MNEIRRPRQTADSRKIRKRCSRHNVKRNRTRLSPFSLAVFIFFLFAEGTIIRPIDRQEDAQTVQIRRGKDAGEEKRATPAFNQILLKAGKEGVGGGMFGAIGGTVQVLALMWLRTTTNYQYRYGTSFTQSIKKLFKEGGIKRFYQGIWFALIQSTLARFGSTAANDGINFLLSSLESTKDWGFSRRTFLASIVVAVWRMIIMPIDTCKTVLQVDSTEGFHNLVRRVRGGKIGVLYHGCRVSAVSAIVSHYPFFYVFNSLSENTFINRLIASPLIRNATMGFLASLFADTCSNSLRVVKTTKQAMASRHDSISYSETISMIVAADGFKGLFFRGLKSRLLANGVQSILFTIVWKGLASRVSQNNLDSDASET